jgi:hypothetical protein
MRARINEAVKAAMKSGAKDRLGTLRMVTAKIKDLDVIIPRPPGQQASDAEITDALTKMVKQRRDSIAAFEKGGRPDLAEKEKAEIAVIEEFLPKGLSEEEAKAAIADVIKKVGAAGPKDMGRVMGALKTEYAGRMDMAKASKLVKDALG